MGVLLLDIETAVDPRPDARERAKASIKVPGNYSKPETIAKYIEDNAEEAYRKTALDGGYGELLIIGAAAASHGAPVIQRARWDFASEADMLEDFYDSLTPAARPDIVGHNVLFDLKFLYHRSAVNGLGHRYSRVFPQTPTPWNGGIFDTMFQWTWDKNKGISLAELASILGVPNGDTTDITGATVQEAYEAGRFEDLLSYNANDLLMTRQVAIRLGLPVLM